MFNKWNGYFITEWRLWIRGYYWFLFIIFGTVLAWLISRIGIGEQNYGYFINQFSFFFLAPISIAAVISGVYIVRRDRISNVDSIINSLPVSTGKLLLFQFIVMAIPFMVLSWVPVGLYIYNENPVLGTGNVYIVLFMISIFVGLLYAISLGWVAGSLVKSRISYLLGFLIWFIHIYGGFLFLSSRLPISYVNLPNFLLLDYKSAGYYDELWGFSVDIAFWLHRGIYSSLILLIMCSAIYLISRRKKEPHRNKYLYFAFISLFMGVIFAFSHIAMQHERASYYQLQTETMKKQNSMMLSSDENNEVSFQINSYDIFLSYVNDGLIKIEAKLEIETMKPSDNKLVFTLKDVFNVHTVTLDGSEVSFRRDGDQIYIDAPTMERHKSIIAITYSGKVEDWRISYYSGKSRNLLPYYFVNAEKINLPAHWGWYPLPGLVQLQIHTLIDHISDLPEGIELPNARYAIQDTYPSLGKADYILTIDYPSNIKILSNLNEQERKVEGNRQKLRFTGDNMEGCILLGGPIKELINEYKGLSVKSIVSEQYNSEHVIKMLTFFNESRFELGRLFDLYPIDSNVMIVPLDYTKDSVMDLSKDFSDRGSYIRVNNYIFSGLYSDETVMHKMVSFILEDNQVASGLKDTEQRELFTGTLAYYILHRYGQSSSELTDFFTSERSLGEVRSIQKYFDSHTDEEIVDFIKSMYGRMQ